MAVRSGFDKKKKVIFTLWILNAISVQVPRTGMNFVNMLTYMTIVTIITIALVHVIAKINAWQTLALCIVLNALLAFIHLHFYSVGIIFRKCSGTLALKH